MRPDIEKAIKDFGNKKSQPNKKEIKSIEELLREGETVIYIADTVLDIATSDKKKKKERLAGVCVLTNQRFLFHKNEYKFLGIGVGGDATESVALDRIDSISASNTAAFNRVQFNAITKQYDILCGDKKEMKKLQQAFEEAAQNYRKGQNTPAAASDPLAQIKQLSELRDSGVISAKEFESKKAELLSRL